MRVVVAVSADQASASEVLALARVEHSVGDPVLDVVTVIPAAWPFRSKARVDAEFIEFHESRATATLEQARTALGDLPDAEFHVLREEGSVATTLLHHVQQVDGDLLVLGSPRGHPGRFSMGSTADALLHRSPVPLLLAPEGYSPAPGTELRRVTVGVSGGPGQPSALALGLRIAKTGGVPLRLATFQVSDAAMAIPVVGFDAERVVDTEWKADLEELHRELIDELPTEPPVESIVTTGETWEVAIDALDAVDGEILVIGCSGHLLRHVFLGTHSNKIIRSASLPVLVAPVA